VLVAATTVATVTRYVALRSWVFARARRVSGVVRASAPR
jgi:putative flippase GtrA